MGKSSFAHPCAPQLGTSLVEKSDLPILKSHYFYINIHYMDSGEVAYLISVASLSYLADLEQIDDVTKN